MLARWIFVTSVLFSVAFVFCGPSKGDGKANTISEETPQTTDSAVSSSLPSYEKDKKGKLLHVDFSLPLKSVSNPDLLFSHFANRSLMIFYFSVKCIHCQRVLPHFQQLAHELEFSGVSAVAVAIKNNSEDDVRSFIRKHNFVIPVFHDAEKTFSSRYGTGKIPLVLVVNSQGEYLRIIDFNNGISSDQIKSVISASVKR
jgi:thiol-disulfide isomerase/thioredoxin